MGEKEIYAELSSIRTMMERSTKFISLNGLSGVMAGVYALIGGGIGYKLLYIDPLPTGQRWHTLDIEIFAVAISVLVLSIATGLWLTIRKAKRRGLTVWNPSSRSLLSNGLIPLITGGIFGLILLSHGYYNIIAAVTLIFYGLALVLSSSYTYKDIKWLGLSEIILGLMATAEPGYGLFFWIVGFGVLHIFYGTLMYFKYDRENSAE